MTRVPEIRREDLSAAGQQIWDVIEKTRGEVFGPYVVLMTVPELAEKVAAVGEQLRFHGILSECERELATIATATEAGSSFEVAIHKPLAKRAGIADETIDAVIGRSSIEALEFRDKLIVTIVRSLFKSRQLPADLFAQGTNVFGQEAMVELITLVGFYEMLALILHAYEVTADYGGV